MSKPYGNSSGNKVAAVSVQSKAQSPSSPPNNPPVAAIQKNAETEEARLIFAPLNHELFNKVARQAAEVVAGNPKFNKPSQIRKFYDELCMWETKVSMEPNRFNDYLPFILMLNAKLAYAKGRKLVDEPFAKLIGDCLKQVKNPDTMRICKLFFEAFLGFYKELRPSDK